MLDILLWILTALGAIVLIVAVIGLAALITIVVFGFRVMRDAETKGDRS